MRNGFVGDLGDAVTVVGANENGVSGSQYDSDGTGGISSSP